MNILFPRCALESILNFSINLLQLSCFISEQGIIGCTMFSVAIELVVMKLLGPYFEVLNFTHNKCKEEGRI